MVFYTFNELGPYICRLRNCNMCIKIDYHILSFGRVESESSHQVKKLINDRMSTQMPTVVFVLV